MIRFSMAYLTKSEVEISNYCMYFHILVLISSHFHYALPKFLICLYSMNQGFACCHWHRTFITRFKTKLNEICVQDYSLTHKLPIVTVGRWFSGRTFACRMVIYPSVETDQRSHRIVLVRTGVTDFMIVGPTTEKQKM